MMTLINMMTMMTMMKMMTMMRLQANLDQHNLLALYDRNSLPDEVLVIIQQADFFWDFEE